MEDNETSTICLADQIHISDFIYYHFLLTAYCFSCLEAVKFGWIATELLNRGFRQPGKRPWKCAGKMLRIFWVNRKLCSSEDLTLSMYLSGLPLQFFLTSMHVEFRKFDTVWPWPNHVSVSSSANREYLPSTAWVNLFSKIPIWAFSKAICWLYFNPSFKGIP